MTEGACATLKSDETLPQRALPQSPTAPAPSRREPIYAKRLKCLQSYGIMRMTTTLGGLYETFIDNYNDTCDDYRIMFM